MEREKRLDPNQLLADIKQEGRGKLTVFLGAAAGVGKTYAMLESARERQKEGIDVVVAWAQPHGRRETEALLEDLYIIPSRLIEYRGKSFQEMDLDAVLARNPQLALVDELAHTNIPGSRHVRRYQDVEELLAAGIDVYTTLNIQHIESLNDVVAQITEIKVRETVPDQIMEEADQIRLVDIPPGELIQRLKDGKVYVPGQAAEALKKFFRPGNINALREMALRYTARRVDHQVESYMRVHGIPGPWPAGERVMVCISANPFSAQLIRIARRMAEGLSSEWLAVYVEADRLMPGNESARDALARNLRLAEELGAETITLAGDDVADEILELARKRNVSQIIIGKPMQTRLWEFVHGSVVDKIIRKSQGLSVHVIPGEEKHPGEHTSDDVRPTPAASFQTYFTAIFLTALLTVLAAPLKETLGLVNIAMLYLLPILFSAVRWGIIPAIVTALTAVLTFDFFLVEPVQSFTVADIRYVITFIIFLIVALFTSKLSIRLRRQISISRSREARVSTLYTISRDIAAVSELQPVMQSIVDRIAESMEGQVAIFLPDQNEQLELTAVSNSQKGAFADNNERGVAVWVFQRGQRAGRGTDTLGGAEGLYLPLRTEQETKGVLGIRARHPEQDLLPEQMRMLEAFTGLAALAVTRVQLAKQAHEARLMAESERLRTALFNSISHDLRTPLASIIGATTGLLEDDGVYTPEARLELLRNIRNGAFSMNRFVNNLLDMARLESGILQLKQEWCDIQDIIGVAVGRIEEQLVDRPLQTKIKADLPLVYLDFILIEQVIVNLLDNALKYSKPDSEIIVSAGRKEESLEISIIDNGREIPLEQREKIFDKFYRLSSPEMVSGTGLGLAICKGFVEAHGGKIWAEPNPAGGEIFTFTLPMSKEIPKEVPLD
jgi:Osmosensitive K+ channel histidine kinase